MTPALYRVIWYDRVDHQNWHSLVFARSAEEAAFEWKIAFDSGTVRHIPSDEDRKYTKPRDIVPCPFAEEKELYRWFGDTSIVHDSNSIEGNVVITFLSNRHKRAWISDFRARS